MPPSYTYSDAPATVPLDAVRFWCGDTDMTAPELSDNECNYALAQFPSDARLAAALLLDQLAMKYARRASITVGAVSKQLGDRSDTLRRRAIDLRSEAGKLAEPFFGGQSESEKEALAADTDAVQPAFTLKQFDNPLSRQFDNEPPDPLTSGTV